MKKLLIISLITILILSLAACGEGNQNTAETTHHAHNYTATTTAFCEKEGVKTFTCSCGDSYTEKISATGHTWCSWVENFAPTYTAAGEEMRTCTVCNTLETREIAKLSLESLFKNYPGELHELGFFTSVHDLSPYDIFTWAITMTEPVSESKDHEKFIYSYTYSVESIDALSEKFFDTKWDLSTISNPEPYSSTEYVYDSATHTVTVIYYGAFGDAGPEVTYKGFREIDEAHFEISYSKAYWGEPPFDICIQVELRNDKLFVTAQIKA